MSGLSPAADVEIRYLDSGQGDDLLLGDVSHRVYINGQPVLTGFPAPVVSGVGSPQGITVTVTLYVSSLKITRASDEDDA